MTKKTEKIGTIISILGLLITIAIVSPKDILRNASEWKTVLASRQLMYLFLGLILGLLSFYLFSLYRKITINHSVIFISPRDFEKKFYELLGSEFFTEIKIFGYTGETITDYFKFSHRYNKNMQVKILNRHWEAEKKDEDEHNERIKNTAIRKWDKSTAIKHLAERPKNFVLKLDTRYYYVHPSIKAIILCNEKESKAFVSFYHWEEMPQDGGAQFKGSNLPMIYVEGQTEFQISILKNLETQFDYLWNISKPA